MSGFLRKGDRLGHELRAARPQAPERLVDELEERVRSAGHVRRRGALRVAVPVGFTAVLAAALAFVGGISYAASSVEHAAQTVSHVFTHARGHEAIIVSGFNSGADQYRPGYGYGDKHHNHYGPPGLGCTRDFPCSTDTPAHSSRTLSARVKHGLALVSTGFSIDEQAHLRISITTGQGKHAILLPITQNPSAALQGAHGTSVKALSYLVLIPRTIPLQLAIPRHLLETGKTYYVRITARGLNNRTSRLYIPFKV
jgi:hypothetical protein